MWRCGGNSGGTENNNCSGTVEVAKGGIGNCDDGSQGGGDEGGGRGGRGIVTVMMG